MNFYKDVRDMLDDFMAHDPRPLRGMRETAEWADLPGTKYLAELNGERFIVMAVTSDEVTLIATVRAPGRAPWQQFRFRRMTALEIKSGE